MSSEKLQKIVDKAYIKHVDGKDIWVLSEEDARDFVYCINNYVKKSAYRSDIYDPDDAYSEIIFGLWKSLTKYGPRPNGKLFGDYVLPLKTNNILTNRANKRNSSKSKLNYVSSSLDSLMKDVSNIFNYSLAVDPIDSITFKESLNEFQEKIVKDKRTKSSIKKLAFRINKDPEFAEYSVVKELLNTIRNRGFLANLSFILSSIDPIEIVFNKDNTIVSNKYGGKIMQNAKVGDKFISPGGKVIEIRRVLEDGYVVNIQLIDQEAIVDSAYLAKCLVYASDTPISINEESSETAKLIEYAKDKEEKEKAIVLSIMPNDGGERSAQRLVLGLLKHGPQSRESLAKALIETKHSKSDDIEKAKGYASVLVSDIKKAKLAKIKSTGRGSYLLEE
jgi:hypothetical protein